MTTNPFDHIKLHIYLNVPLTPELHTISSLHAHLWNDMSIDIPDTHTSSVIFHKRGKFMLDILPQEKKIYFNRDIFKGFNESGIFDKSEQRHNFIIHSISTQLKIPLTDHITMETEEIYSKMMEKLHVLKIHNQRIPIYSHNDLPTILRSS
jgi:hypothetical protein